MTSETKKFSAR